MKRAQDIRKQMLGIMDRYVGFSYPCMHAYLHYYAILYYIILYYIILYYIILYYAVLYNIILCCTILYYTTLLLSAASNSTRGRHSGFSFSNFFCHVHLLD